MTELLNREIYTSSDIYLSIIKRDSNSFKYYAKRFYIFCTRFRISKKPSIRYILSRFHLIKLTKNLGIYDKFNFCFSHTGSYTAVLFSSRKKKFSIDIEKTRRRLSQSLILNIRRKYPELKISELKILMILESLIKISKPGSLINFESFFSGVSPVDIISLKDDVYEVSVNSIKVYSKIYTYRDLFICLTIESNFFESST